MTVEKSKPYPLITKDGKILWAGTIDCIKLDEEMLVKNYGMKKEEAHKFMLELIEVVEDDREI